MQEMLKNISIIFIILHPDDEGLIIFIDEGNEWQIYNSNMWQTMVIKLDKLAHLIVLNSCHKLW